MDPRDSDENGEAFQGECQDPDGPEEDSECRADDRSGYRNEDCLQGEHGFHLTLGEAKSTEQPVFPRTFGNGERKSVGNTDKSDQNRYSQEADDDE